jgi:hypothetical protein
MCRMAQPTNPRGGPVSFTADDRASIGAVLAVLDAQEPPDSALAFMWSGLATDLRELLVEPVASAPAPAHAA